MTQFQSDYAQNNIIMVSLLLIAELSAKFIEDEKISENLLFQIVNLFLILVSSVVLIMILVKCINHEPIIQYIKSNKLALALMIVVINLYLIEYIIIQLGKQHDESPNKRWSQILIVFLNFFSLNLVPDYVISHLLASGSLAYFVTRYCAQFECIDRSQLFGPVLRGIFLSVLILARLLHIHSFIQAGLREKERKQSTSHLKGDSGQNNAVEGHKKQSQNQSAINAKSLKNFIKQIVYIANDGMAIIDPDREKIIVSNEKMIKYLKTSNRAEIYNRLIAQLPANEQNLGKSANINAQQLHSSFHNMNSGKKRHGTIKLNELNSKSNNNNNKDDNIFTNIHKSGYINTNNNNNQASQAADSSINKGKQQSNRGSTVLKNSVAFPIKDSEYTSNGGNEGRCVLNCFSYQMDIIDKSNKVFGKNYLIFIVQDLTISETITDKLACYENLLRFLPNKLERPLSQNSQLTDSLLSLINEELRSKFSDSLRLNFNLIHTKLQNIIDVFRMQSKSIVFYRPKEKCFIKQLLEESVNIFRQAASIKGLQIKFIDDTHLSAIKCDSTSVSQILNNLIENAINFNNQGAIIVHSRLSSNKAHCITISIKDDSSAEDSFSFEQFYMDMVEFDQKKKERKSYTKLPDNREIEQPQQSQNQFSVQNENNNNSSNAIPMNPNNNKFLETTLDSKKIFELKDKMGLYISYKISKHLSKNCLQVRNLQQGRGTIITFDVDYQIYKGEDNANQSDEDENSDDEEAEKQSLKKFPIPLHQPIRQSNKDDEESKSFKFMGDIISQVENKISASYKVQEQNSQRQSKAKRNSVIANSVEILSRAKSQSRSQVSEFSTRSTLTMLTMTDFDQKQTLNNLMPTQILEQPSTNTMSEGKNVFKKHIQKCDHSKIVIYSSEGSDVMTTETLLSPHHISCEYAFSKNDLQKRVNEVFTEQKRKCCQTNNSTNGFIIFVNSVFHFDELFPDILQTENQNKMQQNTSNGQGLSIIIISVADLSFLTPSDLILYNIKCVIPSPYNPSFLCAKLREFKVKIKGQNFCQNFFFSLQII